MTETHRKHAGVGPETNASCSEISRPAPLSFFSGDVCPSRDTVDPPGGVTRGGKWGGSGAAEPGLPLSWTPGFASVLRARPGSGCVGAARIGMGVGTEEDPRGARSVHTTGVKKGQHGLRGPGRTARR